MVCSDGKKGPLIFLNGSVAAKAYLEKVIIPVTNWVKQQYGSSAKNFTFMQNGAPAHTVQWVQEYCVNNFANFWSKEQWPPSSPDATPMDFWAWDRLAKEACKRPHNSVAALKRDILKVWEKISPDETITACKAVPKWLAQIVEAERGHIEKKWKVWRLFSMC